MHSIGGFLSCFSLYFVIIIWIPSTGGWMIRSCRWRCHAGCMLIWPFLRTIVCRWLYLVVDYVIQYVRWFCCSYHFKRQNQQTYWMTSSPEERTPLNIITIFWQNSNNNGEVKVRKNIQVNLQWWLSASLREKNREEGENN